MDKKSKLLFLFLIILIAISVSATFYKTVILQDFEVRTDNFNLDEI